MAAPEINRPDLPEAYAALAEPATVQLRAAALLARVAAGTSEHFVLVDQAMPAVAAALAARLQAGADDGPAELWSCWSDLAVDGGRRMGRLAERLASADAAERARTGADFALLANAFEPLSDLEWSYQGEAGEAALPRDVPPALLAMDLFLANRFGVERSVPRLDVEVLEQITAADILARVNGLAADEPTLQHVIARMRLFATHLRADPARFGPRARFGNLLDQLASDADGSEVAAPLVFTRAAEMLVGSGPTGIRLRGSLLDDVWRHPALNDGEGALRGVVPFHAAPLRLAWSLVAPLEEGGATVTELETLPAPATLRLASAILALGLVRPRHTAITARTHPYASDIAVEWRALAVALAAALTEQVRTLLEADAAALPLGRVVTEIERHARSLDGDAQRRVILQQPA